MLGGSLVITPTKDDAGVYICKAVNDMGQEQVVISFTVYGSYMYAYISVICIWIKPRGYSQTTRFLEHFLLTMNLISRGA